MPQRGPAVLTLALLIGVVGGACRKQAVTAENPSDTLRVAADEQLDVPEICTQGCQRLERCVPELSGDVDGDPTVVAERLARECQPACQGFADQSSASGQPAPRQRLQEAQQRRRGDLRRGGDALLGEVLEQLQQIGGVGVERVRRQVALDLEVLEVVLLGVFEHAPL